MIVGETVIVDVDASDARSGVCVVALMDYTVHDGQA